MTRSARARWAHDVKAIVAQNVFVFAAMGSSGDPAALVHWGGSIAPQTTSGDWWRLLTAAFVHTGFTALFVDLVGLTQMALVLERLLGRLALAAVFLSGAMLQTLINLTANPLTVSVGASSGVLAIYGLLAAVLPTRDAAGDRPLRFRCTCSAGSRRRRRSFPARAVGRRSPPARLASCRWRWASYSASCSRGTS